MRVIVSGGRGYADRERVFNKLHNLAEEHGWLTIIEGGCPTGADTCAREWATEFYHGLVTMKANFREYGNIAGQIRNEKMIISGKPDLLLTFPGGRGTRDMRERAHNHNIKIKFGG